MSEEFDFKVISVEEMYPYYYKLIPGVGVIATEVGLYYKPDETYTMVKTIDEALAQGEELFSGDTVFFGVKMECGHMDIMKANHKEAVSEFGFAPVDNIDHNSLSKLQAEFRAAEDAYDQSHGLVASEDEQAQYDAEMSEII